MVIVPPQLSFLISPTSTTPSAGDLTLAASAFKSTPLCEVPHLSPNGEFTEIQWGY